MAPLVNRIPRRSTGAKRKFSNDEQLDLIQSRSTSVAPPFAEWTPTAMTSSTSHLPPCLSPVQAFQVALSLVRVQPMHWRLVPSPVSPIASSLSLKGLPSCLSETSSGSLPPLLSDYGPATKANSMRSSRMLGMRGQPPGTPVNSTSTPISSRRRWVVESALPACSTRSLMPILPSVYSCSNSFAFLPGKTGQSTRT